MALHLLIATRNPAKARQIEALVDGLGLALTDGVSLAGQPNAPEDGQSHLANAVEKAVAWSQAFGRLAIASDGGLEIPALGRDWSSLITRRGTGSGVSDGERAARLLRRMRGLDSERRACRWTEAIAVARDSGLVGAWESSGLDGYIDDRYVPPEGGTNGFWVSGVWVTQEGRRRWELSDEDLRVLRDPWLALRGPVRGLLERLGKEDAVSAPAE